RHTRSTRDWSSDVCSSDLSRRTDAPAQRRVAGSVKPGLPRTTDSHTALATKLSPATAHRLDQQIKRAFRLTYGAEAGLRTLVRRSEERRVGKGGKAVASPT